MEKQDAYEPGDTLLYRDDNRILVVRLAEDRSNKIYICYDLKVIRPIRQFGMKYIKDDIFKCIKKRDSVRDKDNGWTLDKIAEGSKIPSI